MSNIVKLDKKKDLGSRNLTDIILRTFDSSQFNLRCAFSLGFYNFIVLNCQKRKIKSVMLEQPRKCALSLRDSFGQN